MNLPHSTVRSSVALGLALAALAMSLPSRSEAVAGSAGDPPVVIAQTAAPAARPAASAPEAFPAHERGVRAAAAQGPDSLRRYVARTRMIYAFRYDDFAPKE